MTTAYEIIEEHGHSYHLGSVLALVWSGDLDERHLDRAIWHLQRERRRLAGAPDDDQDGEIDIRPATEEEVAMGWRVLPVDSFAVLVQWAAEGDPRLRTVEDELFEHVDGEWIRVVAAGSDAKALARPSYSELLALSRKDDDA